MATLKLKNRESQTTPKPVKKAGRGVSYPWINLETAIKRAQEFWDIEVKNEVPVTSAYQHWGYGLKSSGARLTVSAMLKYGLMSAKGVKDDRLVKLTDRAIDILVPPDEKVKERAIKQAAMKPKVFAELLRQWEPENLPSDQTIKHYLIKKDVNLNAVETFIRNFRDTIKFSKLTSSDKMSLSVADANSDEDEDEELGKQMQDQYPGINQPGIDAIRKSFNQLKGQQVGASIPVSANCSMSIIANGLVTQDGLDKLVAYINLIKGSFPKSEVGTAQDA